MSTEMIRRLIKADELRSKINASRPQLGTLAQYRHIPIQSRTMSTTGVLLALRAALGERIAAVFVEENPMLALSIAEQVIQDHLAYVDRDHKDLQVNLVANLTIQLTRAQNLHRAKRFNYGENLIRACKLSPEFKLALKVLMFDKKGIDLPWIVTTRFDPNAPATPGIWSV